MAENMPTPPSPGAGRYSGAGPLSSGNSDTAHDSTSDRVDISPERRMLHFIEEHDKEFREKLDVLTKFANILANDHAKAISHLKRACREYAARNHSYKQARAFQKAPEPTVEESMWDAPRQAEEVTEPLVVNPTSAQLVTGASLGDMRDSSLEPPSQTVSQQVTEPLIVNSISAQLVSSTSLEDVRNPSLEPPSQTVSQPVVSGPVPDGDHLEVDPPARVDESSGGEHESSSPNDTEDDSASSYSTDDGDHDKDIYHEESPTPDEIPQSTNVEAQSTATPQKSGAQNRPAPASQPSKSSQSARDGSRRWTEEEENCMIEIIHDLMQQEDPGPSKSRMWQRASAMMRTRGYDRTYQQMMAKWSYQTRYKCEDRGLDWAAKVMAKVPHMERKRKSSSGDVREARRSSTSDEQPGIIPTPSKSQKVRHNQPRPDGKVKVPKPRGRPRKSSKKHPALSPQQGFTTKFDSLPTTSETHMRLRFVWARTSNDIVQVDWSADSKYFVAASTSLFNPEKNFSDNRPVNLVHGSLPSKTLRELPEHRVAGNVIAGQPEYVYRTVSAVRFAPTGHRIYSAGFDNKVRVWDVEDEAFIHCKTEIQFAQRLEVMDVAGEQSALFATGTAGGLKSIRVFFTDSDLDVRPQEIRLLRDTEKKPLPFSPTCLKFGHARTRDWLLAGFGSDDDGGFSDGYTAMWKFREASCEQLNFPRGDKFVFHCAWSPSGELFAIGSASDAMSRADTAEHSVVKLYSANQPDSIARYSCRAKDINDVTIDYGLVTASCTDGSTYVWDQRQPQKPLHILAHGQPLAKLAPGADRELEDVGVRYIEWSGNAGQLYTGASDGVLKYWDTRHSPADVLVEDLVDTGSEIMCGRLSPDHSSLLLGDDDGRLHLLSMSNGPFPDEEWRFRVAEQWDIAN
ncbi:uncharacterized protein Z520_04904 [Fonsecaea multimorphosa CBS 102226]|uniref:Myb-like domain-containing protein n=1 Tax=Fonsecaea multimorphosa CBS 102226 TaxID=1442371 RepID=A0A0D2KRI9_9EURO|nr:uncharacterized protein Z520_04904 [Fonsecaea multimorphosa CBS 102226]KIX99328.1 hypothetical protein Z520_04904 [Fonsecaea multimorphosa CBS 102226]OAL25658.1 hypothetical protein AYO22_04647 [Fonsecaea multimorphosa]